LTDQKSQLGTFDMNPIPAGKLPIDFLKQLLDKVEICDPRVVLGPKVGEDAALIDIGDKFLVAKTDPITFATDLIGWYLVQVNANDIAAMGGKPLWLMSTLLLPENFNPQEIKDIFDQMIQACNQLGITLIGGHTEITYGLERPIAIGAMLGEVEKPMAVFTAGAKPGDSIVLTKNIAIEGTALLAREMQESLEKNNVKKCSIEKAKALLFSPGISIIKESAIACKSVNVHSMHDPTEGGLASGLLEIAHAAKVGLMIRSDRIPILPECEEFCEKLGIDPMGLIASGSLIVTVDPVDTETLINALVKEGIPAHEIGKITNIEEGLKLHTSNGIKNFPKFDRDELAKLLTK